MHLIPKAIQQHKPVVPRAHSCSPIPFSPPPLPLLSAGLSLPGNRLPGASRNGRAGGAMEQIQPTKAAATAVLLGLLFAMLTCPAVSQSDQVTVDIPEPDSNQRAVTMAVVKCAPASDRSTPYLPDAAQCRAPPPHTHWQLAFLAFQGLLLRREDGIHKLPQGGHQGLPAVQCRVPKGER